MSRIGRYELHGVIGRGSMATVHEARLAGGGPVLALKILNDADLELMERLRREAEILRRLDGHPNVVRCHEVGEERGRPYFVMDLARGGTLAEALRTSQISPDDACRALVLVARALHAAHEAGVVHRDVKPSNILLGEDGTPLVADFGLAKDLRSRSLTQSGVMLGTVAFMAPEQIDSRQGVDRRADVYALGGILYSVVAGRVPFSGPATVIAQKVLRETPEPLRAHKPDVDPRLEAICARALAKPPDQRFATAEDFAAALEAALKPLPPRSRAVRKLAGGAALAVLLLAVFVAGRATGTRPVTGTRTATFEEALATLRGGKPLDAAQLDALAVVAREGGASIGTLAETLPFLRARSALLAGDQAATKAALALLPAGAPRRILEAEVHSAQRRFEEAFAALGAAGDATVPWLDRDAPQRWVELARACEAESAPLSARSSARAAAALARARPGATGEVAALADRAFAADARAACPELGPLVPLLRGTATALIARGDAPSLRLARRRLLMVRLTHHDEDLAEPVAAFAELARTAESSEVRHAARPWTWLAHELEIADVDGLVAGAERETALDDLKLGIAEACLQPPSGGLTALLGYEAYTDLILMKPAFGTLWWGFMYFATVVGRFDEAHRALDLEESRPSFQWERGMVRAALETVETGKALELPPPTVEPGRPLEPGRPPGPGPRRTGPGGQPLPSLEHVQRELARAGPEEWARALRANIGRGDLPRARAIFNGLSAEQQQVLRSDERYKALVEKLDAPR